MGEFIVWQDSPDASGRPRHNVDIEMLVRDPDPRYRPRKDLADAVRRSGDLTTLDRPLVPALNALFERGIETFNSCVNSYIACVGTGTRTLAALEAMRLPGMRITWWLGGVSERFRRSTGIEWDREAHAAWSGEDASFFEAARRIRTAVLPARDQDAAAVPLMLHVGKRLETAGAAGYGPGRDLPSPDWQPGGDPYPRCITVSTDGTAWRLDIEKEGGREPGSEGLFDVSADSLSALGKAVDRELDRLCAIPTATIRAREHEGVRGRAAAHYAWQLQWFARRIDPDVPVHVATAGGGTATWVIRDISFGVTSPEGVPSTATDRALFRNGILVNDPRKEYLASHPGLRASGHSVTVLLPGGGSAEVRVPSRWSHDRLSRTVREIQENADWQTRKAPPHAARDLSPSM